MGTRADFYIGHGKKAEWLGSIAYDGYPHGQPFRVIKAKTEHSFRKRVCELLSTTDDATTPEQGWPWAWDTSRLTDYSYAFDGNVWIACYGSGWITRKTWKRAIKAGRDPFESLSEQPFPDMSSARKCMIFGKRSGFLLFGGS